MTQAHTNNFQRITDYVDLVYRKPKKGVRFFFFEIGKRFIVDGKKIKLLPLDISFLYEKNEFWIQIDLANKTAEYYAFNIKDFVVGEHIDEVEGYIPWDKIENCLYNFFVLNIKELSDTSTPYADVNNVRNISSANTTTNPVLSEKKEYPAPSVGPYTSPYTNSSNYNYNSTSYKERETFYDKLWLLLKDNKTSVATDLISDHFTKVMGENRFDDINHILSFVAFDKLNIPSMISILRATKKQEASLRDRKTFFEKVEKHLIKVKPNLAPVLLKELSPIKENTVKN